MAHALVLIAAVAVLLGATNGPVGRAISNFVLMGIIPGTSIQIPWYVSLLLTPFLLFGLSKIAGILLDEIDKHVLQKAPVAAAPSRAGKPTRSPASRSQTIIAILAARTDHARWYAWQQVLLAAWQTKVLPIAAVLDARFPTRPARRQ